MWYWQPRAPSDYGWSWAARSRPATAQYPTTSFVTHLHNLVKDLRVGYGRSICVRSMRERNR